MYLCRLMKHVDCVALNLCVGPAQPLMELANSSKLVVL